MSPTAFLYKTFNILHIHILKFIDTIMENRIMGRKSTEISQTGLNQF